MPYRLRQDENVRAGLRRCAREQLETAVDELTNGVKDDPVSAVHEAVVELLDRRRDELEARAFEIGERLYAERPKAFSRRLHRYWKASRSGSHARPAALA